MTEIPQPVRYASPELALPPRRPQGVTFISILGIVYGCLGVLCVGGGMVVNLVTNGSVAGGGGGGAGGAPKITFPPEVQAFGAAAGAVGILLSLMLLLGAIGAMGLKPWARTLLLGFAVVDLIYDVGKAIVNVLWLQPKMQQALVESGIMNDPKVAQAMKWWQPIGQIIGWVMFVFVIALPIAILIVMNGRPAKEAFGVVPPQEPLIPAPGVPAAVSGADAGGASSDLAGPSQPGA